MEPFDLAELQALPVPNDAALYLRGAEVPESLVLAACRRFAAVAFVPLKRRRSEQRRARGLTS
jgi:hypothetical protein